MRLCTMVHFEHECECKRVSDPRFVGGKNNEGATGSYRKWKEALGGRRRGRRHPPPGRGNVFNIHSSISQTKGRDPKSVDDQSSLGRPLDRVECIAAAAGSIKAEKQ